MEHAELREGLEAYALGALDAEEAEAVAVHLLSCPDCRAELTAYRRVADGLPSALGSASPLRAHPSLKQRLLAGVQTPKTRRRAPLSLLSAAAAAVALLVVAGTALWSLHIQQELNRSELVRSEQLAMLKTTLSPADQLRVIELIDSNTRVKRVLKAVDPSSASSGHAYGRLYSRTDGDDVVVMVNLLPQPPPGQRYELLLTSDGRTTDAGTLKLDQDGFALLLFKAERKGPTYQRAVVMLGDSPVLQWEGSN